MSVDCWDCSRQSDSRLTQDKENKAKWEQQCMMKKTLNG